MISDYPSATIRESWRGQQTTYQPCWFGLYQKHYIHPRDDGGCSVIRQRRYKATKRMRSGAASRKA
jgi:hypothetical protein